MPPKRKRTASQRSAASKRARSASFARDAAAFTSTRIVPTARLGRGPIPNRAIVTLKYSQLNNSNGAAVDYMFNLNSLFDPDRTGVGHQPLGFDQYSAFYNRYKVFKCKVTVQATCTGSLNCIGIVGDNVGSTYAGLTNFREQPGSMLKVLNSGGPTVFLQKTFKLWDLTGKTWKEYMADDTYGAVMSASPAEVIVAHIGFWDISGATIANNTLFWISTLEFSAELYDPIPLGSS